MLGNWLRQRISLEEAEVKYSIQSDDLGHNPVPFGYINAQWRELVSKAKDGDELWEFRSSDDSWEHLAGDAGVVLMRNGEIIDMITTEMN